MTHDRAPAAAPPGAYTRISDEDKRVVRDNMLEALIRCAARARALALALGLAWSVAGRGLGWMDRGGPVQQRARPSEQLWE